MKRIVIGISGATGVILGYYLLAAFKKRGDFETHLVVSPGAARTWELEVDFPIEELYEKADFVHSPKDLAASISSGSFKTEGMIVMPCSMKTLSAVASGYTDNLLTRAADVCLKENRRVVLVTREMPLSKVHLKNMLAAADAGCVIMPPVLTFYNNSVEGLDAQIHHLIGKIFSQFGLEYSKFDPWQGAEDE